MAAIAAEVEAKLLAPDLGALAAVAGMQDLRGYRLVPRRRAQLHTVYLDTPELSLARAGVALRVRRDGARWEATAKWMGRVRGGVHARPELTVSLAAPPRAGFRVPRGPLRDRLCALICGRPLAPILVNEIERRTFDLRPAGAARGARTVFAELALDRVCTSAPKRRGRGRPRSLAEYGELEIELRNGSAQALTALARELQRELGFTLAAGNKFTRGLALVYGSAGLAVAPAQPPDAHDTVVGAARKVIAQQLAQIRAHDPDVRSTDDPHAVHAMRVAVRRARAALRAFADGLPERTRGRLTGELRWLGARLGQVRDLDVQLAEHARTERAARGSERRAISALRARLRAEHARRREALLRALDSQRYFALLLALESFALARAQARQGAAARAPLPAAARARLQRTMRTVRKRGCKLTRSAQPPSAEQLHELRIRAKRVRYMLEFIAELTGKPGQRLVERLVELQDLLGEHQDATVAVESIARHGGAGGAANGGGVDALIRRQQRRAARARARFDASFREFAGPEAQRDLRKVLRRLAGANLREPRAAKGARG